MRALRDLEARGQTPAILSDGVQALGVLGVADQIREEAPDALAAFVRQSAPVPLVKDGRGLGTITLARNKGGFDAREIALFESFARQAVVALDKRTGQTVWKSPSAGGDRAGKGHDVGPAQQVVNEIKALGSDGTPRRVSVWDAETGAFVQELFGSSSYGAIGAAVNPRDPFLMVGQGCEHGFTLKPASDRDCMARQCESKAFGAASLTP